MAPRDMPRQHVKVTLSGNGADYPCLIGHEVALAGSGS